MFSRRMTRNIYLLGLLSLFNDLTADMITPLLPAFLAGMGMGAGFLGIMEGLANSLSHITVLFSGWYADRHGQNKKITVFGYSLSTYIRLLIAIPLPFVTLSVRLLDRIGKGIRTAPRDNLITASSDKKQWGISFGIHRAMDHAGALLAPPLATWLLSAYGLKLSTLFLIACIPSILSVILVPRFIQETPAASSSMTPRLTWKKLPPPLKRYVFIIFFSALSTPSELFLILRMQKLGLPTFQMPLAWFLLTFFTLLAAYAGGFLADRWSRRRTIGLGWLLFSLVYFGFALNTDLRWAWLLIALYGLHMGVIEASERVYPARIVSAENRAAAIGWYYFAYGMGLFPASLIFGLLWESMGAQFAFLLNAVLTLIAIFVLFIFLPSDRKSYVFIK